MSLNKFAHNDEHLIAIAGVYLKETTKPLTNEQKETLSSREEFNKNIKPIYGDRSESITSGAFQKLMPKIIPQSLQRTSTFESRSLGRRTASQGSSRTFHNTSQKQKLSTNIDEKLELLVVNMKNV